MGQRKVDQTFPKPAQNRHVWIRSPDRWHPPTQAFVLEWRRHSYRWSALVLYVDPDGRAVQEWKPAEDLRPVHPVRVPDFFDHY